MLKNNFFWLFMPVMFFISCDQRGDIKEQTDNDEIMNATPLKAIDLPIADIAILGTFHYVSNVDSYKRKYHIDVTSEKTQKQINGLLERLKTYAPTKVMVEQSISDQMALDSLYQEYKRGTYNLTHNESQQLGFRLAKMLGHDHIYAVDVHAPYEFEYEIDFDRWEEYARKTGHLEKWNTVKAAYRGYHETMDSLKTTMPLTDYYRLLNSKATTRMNLQEKLSGLVELGATDTYLGADGITHDFRRNLRIYANILSLIENEDDRFLLIIGSNHNTILQPFFETSLEFNYVDINDYLE